MQRIIFFDGVCPLCNRFINFVFTRDKRRYFKYASLQSNSAIKILNKQDLKLDTIIYIEDGKLYNKSAAILRILYHLGGLFKAISIITSIVPSTALDFIYTKIANNRYKVFGQSDTCRLPSAAEKNYFLD